MDTIISLPDQLKPFAGRIVDVDAHEMMPLQEWEKCFGPEIRALCDAWSAKGETDDTHANHPNIPDYEGDVGVIDANIVNVKGSRKAPGTGDPARRLQVLDAMGIGRQLMFPGSAGLYGIQLVINHRDREFLSTITGDRKAYGERCVDLYNEWIIDAFGSSSNRVRAVAPVYGDTVKDLYDRTFKLIKRGVKAIWLPAPSPPGGKSPAHPDLDPYWSMLAEAGVTVTTHLGSEGNFFETLAWRDAPAFDGHKALSEFKLDPWTLSNIHWQCQNYLATMINGGVFVRHPKLRFASIEVGAYWIGPMMEALDLWHVNLGVFNKNVHKLPELPSHYVKQNVRATIFPFEPIDQYIERYQMDDVLCFATDYPHIEGGKDIFNSLYKKLERLGPKVVEKFFVTNGEWLLPN